MSDVKWKISKRAFKKLTHPYMDGRVLVYVSVCLSFRKSWITFDGMKGSWWNVQDQSNSVQVILFISLFNFLYLMNMASFHSLCVFLHVNKWVLNWAHVSASFKPNCMKILISCNWVLMKPTLLTPVQNWFIHIWCKYKQSECNDAVLNKRN